VGIQLHKRGNKHFLNSSFWFLAIALLSIALLACCWMLYQSFLLPNQERVYGAFYGGMTAALATTLGALPVLVTQQYSRKTYAMLLGFGAGVMLAACSFSLIIPGLEHAKNGGLSSLMSSLVVGGGILFGALLMSLMDCLMPHEHFDKGREGPSSIALKRAWLFVIAITLHNFPEGLSIGFAFAGTNLLSAEALAIGISIQDIPEGLVVALALRGVGYSRIRSFILSMLTGLVEPVAALLGIFLVGLNPSMLPFGLGFAAGAMLFVISHEIIPESHRSGREHYATIGAIVGFVLMMFLDTTV
jgi:ZIP family zinc transporter